MRLRTRTVLLVFFLVAIASLGLSLASRFYLYPQFVELEDEQAIRNANIGLELLNNEVGVVADRPADWGYWDDTYQFALDKNQDYIISNLGNSTLYSLQINLIGMYDRQGNKIWSQAIHLDTQENFLLDEYAKDKLPLTHPLLSHEDEPQTRAGIMNTSRGPIFLASTPILTSDRIGPSRGTIIFGRFFDSEKIRRIVTQPGLELKLSPHVIKANEQDLITIEKGDGRLLHTPLKIKHVNDITWVETTLLSIDGKPSIDMMVSMPSEISRRGLKTLNSITLAIGLAGFLLSLVLTYILNRVVTAPITRITQHLAHIGHQEDISARLQLKRNDEIGDLANEFDDMLQRLNDTRKHLFKQNYDTGASEMARSVIQNIGKNIQPLRENIELPLSLLDKTHNSTSSSLIHELAESKTGGHRFIEITQQLLDLNDEQALLLAEARSEMRRLRINVEQLQELITEYSKFITQTTDTGATSLANLLDIASKKLGTEERKRLIIDIDPGIYRIAPVAASQNLLQQVINVLLTHFVNAADSSVTTPMTLRITCRTELSHGRAQLHFCFDDNRARLTINEFQNYIANTWIANDTDAGLGLSWAESAVTAMAGKLYAEASQTQEGIAIHLILPRAKIEEN